MPKTIPESAREPADLALAVYVEELAVRRRVLFVGDANSAVPQRLDRVARSVDIVSPRVRSRRSSGTRPWPSQNDAGAWDLVIVPDLIRVGAASLERITEMREWLSRRGVLVVGIENRSEHDYDEFYDLLSDRFESVRMLGQTPFSGWSVVDFAAKEEPEVVFDGTLMGIARESPFRYIALCSEYNVILDAYAVIQAPHLPSESKPDERKVAELEALIDARREDLERALEVIDEIEKKHDLLASQKQELEARLRDSAAQARDAASQAREFEKSLGEARSEVKRASKQADELRKELRETRSELQSLRTTRESDDLVNAECARLEASLAERGHEISQLKVELERRATLVRDLVEELRERSLGASEVRPVPSMESFVVETPSANTAMSSPSPEIEVLLQRVRGERAGLRFRLENLEQALASIRERALRSAPEAEAQIVPSRTSLGSPTIDQARHETELARLRGQLVVRDDLIARLQSACVHALTQRDEQTQRAHALGEALVHERESTDSAQAIANSRYESADQEILALRERVRTTEEARRVAERDQVEARNALADARNVLAQLASGLSNESGFPPVADADLQVHEQLARAQREVVERDTMLHKLSNQLRMRDERIEELERDPGGAASDLAPELRRLQQLLGDRDAQLMVLEGRIASHERDARSMRDTVAEARMMLELLLGDIASDQRAEASDRVGALLRMLRRH